jgi:hypothetical protein
MDGRAGHIAPLLIFEVARVLLELDRLVVAVGDWGTRIMGMGRPGGTGGRTRPAFRAIEEIRQPFLHRLDVGGGCGEGPLKLGDVLGQM